MGTRHGMARGTARRAVIVGGAALGGALLAACGGGGGGATERPAASRQPAQLGIAWWGPPDQVPAYDEAVKDYAGRNPHVTFDVIWPGNVGPYTEKIQTMGQAGGLPDVILMENSNATAGVFVPFVKPGFVQDITDKARAARITREQYLPGAFEGSSFDGKLFGLPYVMNAYALFSNNALFKQAGLQTPQQQFEAGKWDWTAFVDTAKRLTDPNKQQWGYIARGVLREVLAWSNGGRYLSADGKKVTLADPTTVRGLEQYYDTVRQKITLTPNEQRDLFGGAVALQNGNAAMGEMGCWDLLLAESKWPFDWNIAPWPAGPQGRHAVVWAGQWGLGKGSKHADQAFDVIKDFTSAPGLKIATEKKVGRVPAKQDVLDRYYYDAWKGKNVGAFVQAFGYGRTQAVGGAANTELENELTLVEKGEKGVRAATEAAQPRIQALIDSGQLPVQLDLLKYRPGGK